MCDRTKKMEYRWEDVELKKQPGLNFPGTKLFLASFIFNLA
jgi:hypothetical protein